MKLATSADPKESVKIAREIHKLVIDNGVMIPLGEMAIKTAYNKSINIGIAAEAPAFWNLTKTGK
jgi:peptide/nickel transport system substrate-binding protein